MSKIIAQVILLPTEGKSKLGFTSIKGDELTYGNERTAGAQHLYITDDSKLKKGDWYLLTRNGIPLAVEQFKHDYELPITDKKIIATTDPDLTKGKCCGVHAGQDCSPDPLHGCSNYPKNLVPQLQQSFIEAWCKNPVDKVMVEYEETFLNNSNKAELQHSEFVFKPKLTSNNELIISMIEEKLYTRDEVEELLRQYGNAITKHTGTDNDGESCYCTLDRGKWIKRNL